MFHILGGIAAEHNQPFYYFLFHLDYIYSVDIVFVTKACRRIKVNINISINATKVVVLLCLKVNK